MSIRDRLVRSSMILATCVVLAAGAGFWVAFRGAIFLETYLALISDAVRLGLMVERNQPGDPSPYTIDLRPQLFSLRYSGPEANGYYQAWSSDGTTIARSPSLGALELERPSLPDHAQGPWAYRPPPEPDPERVPRFENQDLEIVPITLPDGQPGIQCWIRYNPKRGPMIPRPGEPDDFIVIAVAQSDTWVNAQVRDLTIIIASFAIIALLVFRLVIGLVISRGLKPLRVLTSEVEHLDAAPGSRVRETGMSRETAPVASALNALLARSEQTLERERRFSENAAHELRTPLAEIRVVADVARRLGTREAAAEAVQDIAQSAAQMDAVLSTLLRISRRKLDAAHAPPQRVDVAACFARSLRRHAEALARRRVRVEQPAASVPEVLSDPAALGTSISNLIDNAAEYTPDGGLITIDASSDAHWLTIRVSNGPVALSGQDVERMFEPFWRKDPTRGQGDHSGLGLSIVRAICEHLDGTVTPALSDGQATSRGAGGNVLTMTVRLAIVAGTRVAEGGQ